MNKETLSKINELGQLMKKVKSHHYRAKECARMAKRALKLGRYSEVEVWLTQLEANLEEARRVF